MLTMLTNIGNREVVIGFHDFKCSQSFNSKVHNKGLIVGNIIGFYEGETSMEGYTHYTVDTYHTIGFVNHKIDDHFIDFNSEVINHQFGCGRSFPSTELNLFDYIKYVSSSVKYNIIADDCINMEGKFNLM